MCPRPTTHAVRNLHLDFVWLDASCRSERPTRLTDAPPPSVIASDCKATTRVKVVLLLLPSPSLATGVLLFRMPRSLSPSLSLPACSLQHPPPYSLIVFHTCIVPVCLLR